MDFRLLRGTSPVADNISANIVSMGLATLLRFWGCRTLIFDTTTQDSKSSAPITVRSRSTRDRYASWS